MLPQLPPVTKALLIANLGMFILQWALGDLGAGLLPSDAALSPLMLWPLSNGFDAFSPGASFMPWQLLTYAFLHGGFNHLFFNMLALFMFGAPLEQTWGQKRFLTYYLVCVAGAGVCQLLMAWFTQSGAPVLGASGGVWLVARLRHVVPEPAGDAAVSADPDEGTDLRDRVRCDRAAAWRNRLAAGRCPLRTPGRHAVRVVVDPPLARPAALRWQARQGAQAAAACGALNQATLWQVRCEPVGAALAAMACYR